jgi:hypothetical protein
MKLPWRYKSPGCLCEIPHPNFRPIFFRRYSSGKIAPTYDRVTVFDEFDQRFDEFLSVPRLHKPRRLLGHIIGYRYRAGYHEWHTEMLGSNYRNMTTGGSLGLEWNNKTQTSGGDCPSLI